MNTNCTVYAFGNFDSGYTQYPLDYAKKIFRNLFSMSTAPTQVAVLRSKNLMYYNYVRKLDEGQNIGFCILLNGVFFTKPRGLFPIFEKTVELLVTNCEILGFNSNGKLIPYVESLNEKQYEIGIALSNINNESSKLPADKLPVLRYGVARNQNRYFHFEEGDDDKVVNATTKNGLTFITKDKDYDTETLVSKREVILESVKHGTIDPSKIEHQRELSLRGKINRLLSSIRKELFQQ